MLSINGNAVDRVPLRATWPPPWMSQSADTTNITDTPAVPTVVSKAELTPPALIAQPCDDSEQEILASSATPCLKCGSLDIWWDVIENQHCMYCHPPRRDCEALRARAIRLRAIADRRAVRGGG